MLPVCHRLYSYTSILHVLTWHGSLGRSTAFVVWRAPVYILMILNRTDRINTSIILERIFKSTYLHIHVWDTCNSIIMTDCSWHQFRYHSKENQIHHVDWERYIAFLRIVTFPLLSKRNELMHECLDYNNITRMYICIWCMFIYGIKKVLFRNLHSVSTFGPYGVRAGCRPLLI